MSTVWKRIFKWAGWLLGGACALVVVLYLVVLLINLRDQPPSEFALRLESLYRDRPAVADADNGYIYLMGFPADQPPHSPAAQQIIDACGWGSNNCDTALAEIDATQPEWFNTEQWRVDRYRMLLARPGWQETLPPDLMAPWPDYSPALNAHRLLLARAHSLAGQKDGSGVREILEQDMRFWRLVLAASDTLLTKMIAGAALARHFHMGNLALRRLPSEMQLAAMPEAWRTPLTDQELSWHRSFAGEWVYSRTILRQITTQRAMPADVGLEEPGWLSRLQELAQRPLFQLQDTSNQSAEMLARAADALQVPIERFTDGLDAAKAILAAPARRVFTFDSLYNPIGDLLSAMGSGHYALYPPRVADIEGARRAAVLATELRSRKVDATNIVSELAASDLRIPYTGAAFTWDAETQSIVFIGLVPGERGQHAFKY